MLFISFKQCTNILMKKLLLFLFCLTQAMGLLAQEWMKQLVDLNADIIDSVVCMPKTAVTNNELETYMIHYHQPLQHDNPELGNLPLRALLAVRKTEDCTQQMMQTFITGYYIDSIVVRIPDSLAVKYQTYQQGELFGRYEGNLLMPEHRYFGESCPKDPWNTLGYCEAKEAAADFHALFEAMKKVFSGKWAISGGSKGGITTVMQHAFYPDDADCYVAYSAPFLGYYHDTRMQEYSMEHSLTPELNERLLSIQRNMMSNSSLFELYCRWYQANTGAQINEANMGWVMATYMYRIADFAFQIRAYKTRKEITDALDNTERLLAENYNNQDYYTMLLYILLTGNLKLDDNYKNWHDQTFGNNQVGATRGVFGVAETTYKSSIVYPYWYQAIHELGYYDFKWDYYYTEQKDIDAANQMWQSYYNNALEFASNGSLKDVKYNPDLIAFVRQQTAQAKKPILFIYGGDDMWTGARMEDEYINGENVQLYILPEQNHMVRINGVTDKELQAKLWAFTDAVFNSQTAISQIRRDDASSTSTYDLQGRKVSDSTKGLVIKNRRIILKK